ncbi:MAG: hypothetical protein MUO54_17230 [Anaerolineales bacterium]|nr:hypothetical protein [Anaerolineales bacterium]
MITGASKEGKFIPGWFWVFFVFVSICILARWLFWWFFCPSYQRTSAVEIETPRSKPNAEPIKKDDFRKLKGIGPKTAEALYKLGILTFEQLGLINSEKLIQILKSENIPGGKADFWQQQAKLAAAEDWKKLETLQNKS